MCGRERALVESVFDSNWIAPLGPEVEAFEHEFAAAVGAGHSVALSSGTAALHLALKLVGVTGGDEVLVSTLTFAASVNPIVYLGGCPTFIDCDRTSWNMDPALLADAVEDRARKNWLPKAVVLVHLYGQSADIAPIKTTCDRYGIALVEDAAEALGASYGQEGRGPSRDLVPGAVSAIRARAGDRRSAVAADTAKHAPGTFGRAGIFSFNGNKIITTSSGGMLVSDDADIVQHARRLATQARDPFVHYEHSEIGYNYRMSNLLAAIGRAQLTVLEDRVKAKRRIFDFYLNSLKDLPGIAFMPESAWGRATRWLTCITIDPAIARTDRETVRVALEAENIESRPVWKPMHLQPVFAKYESIGGAVAADLFEKGLCLPCGTAMTEDDLLRIVRVIRGCWPCRSKAGRNPGSLQ
jgi:pyridoxal phosphate-dependent aminotransferase EpsN